MLDKLLREAVALVLGKGHDELVGLLMVTKHANEFTIASKLELTINQVRNLLYRLSDAGLVSSIRKKDKKKGWFTYYWRIENVPTLKFLRQSLEKRRDLVTNQITTREKNQFFFCETCALEFSEADALHLDFSCPECGAVLQMKDDSTLLKQLRKNLDRFSAEIEEINEYFDKEMGKVEKKRARSMKKEAEEKARKRAEAAAKRAAARKLSAKKKAPKKVVKKTVKKKTANETVKKKTAKKTKKKAAPKKNVVNAVKKSAKNKTTKKRTKK